MAEKKTAPKAGAPVEEHRKHIDEFLTREEFKKPKGPAPKSDTANP